MKALDKYVNDVLSEKIVTGLFIKQAVQRYLSDLDRQLTSDFPYVFDLERVKNHITFAEVCRHWKGPKAGQRIELEPHQVFLWAQLYGWVNPETDVSRFHRSLKLVARKNYKTTEAAIMGLDHLLINPPAGAQVYAGATKNEQAMLVVNDAGKIIMKTPELTDKFQLFKFRDKVSRVVSSDMDGFFAPMSKETDNSTQDGLDPSMAFIDEYHAHPNDAIYNVIESGMGNRPGWFIGIISTAGNNKQGPCYSVMRDLGKKVLSGILTDDETLFLMHEPDENKDGEIDWQDENEWIKANPRMLNDPNFHAYLVSRFKMAKLQGGEKESDFKTKNLNLWVDQYNSWINDDVYMKCQRNMIPEDLYGLEAYGGLDLAASRDFNSFVITILVDGTYHLIPYFWIPSATLERRKEKLDVDLPRWVKDGFVKVIQGESVDYDFMARDIKEICKKYNVKSIGLDPRNENAIRHKLDIKMGGFVTVNTFSQDMGTMSYPTKHLEKLIVDNLINHFCNPVLRWMFSNVAIYTDANENIKLVKNKSVDKIDGVVSSVMAIGEWLTYNVINDTSSVYDGRGVVSF